ncbi:MAG TPA: efflux RND transporter periplasmic adaptor subunit [Acidobacteriaceae bacterium]
MAANNKQGNSTPVAIWGTAAVLILLAIYAVHSLSRQKIEVHTGTVSYQDLLKTANANGKVELTDDFQARAQAPGQVERIYVSPLQKIQKGQLLLKLGDAAAQASLAHAQAALQAAQVAAANVAHGGSQEEHAASTSDLDRANLQLQQDAIALATAQKLQARGAASPAEVASAQHRIDMDESNLQGLHARTSQRYTPADVSSANAQVADARAAVAAAQSALANDLIRSPIAGSVYYLPVSQYDYVESGEELIDVANMGRLRIAAYFDEPDIGTLAVNQPVVITWEAQPGKTWHGHVSQIPSTIIQYQNRFVGQCIIDVDDADGVLTPNANVHLKVTLAEHPHVLAVPRGALKFDSHGQPYVFRIRDGKLVRTDVRTGIVNLTSAEIVSGLSEGDTVATNATGNVELIDGQSVTATPGS